MKIREPATCNIQVNWVSLICQSKRQPKVFRRRMFGLPFNLTDSKILICFRISRTPFISPSLSHTFTVPLSRISHCPCVYVILYCLPATFFSSALSLCVLSRHIYWQNVPALTDATAYTEKSHIYSIEIERKSRALAIHTIRYQIIPWKWVSRTFERNFSRDKNTSHKCWSNRSASRDVNKISIWFTNTEPFIYIFYII